jgi:4-carboxymuconolactone decarboxylase
VQQEDAVARLSAPRREDLPSEEQAVYDAIVKSRGQVSGPFTVLMHSPEVAGRIAEVGAYVRFESKLPIAVRCLAAIVAARALDCRYVWAAWVPQAQRAGIGDEIIAAIQDRRPPPGLTAEQALVVAAGQQLLGGNHQLADDTYAALVEHFGPSGLAELTATFGYFSLLAMPLNAFQVDPRPDGPVLPI